MATSADIVVEVGLADAVVVVVAIVVGPFAVLVNVTGEVVESVVTGVIMEVLLVSGLTLVVDAVVVRVSVGDAGVDKAPVVLLGMVVVSADEVMEDVSAVVVVEEIAVLETGGRLVEDDVDCGDVDDEVLEVVDPGPHRLVP